MSKPIQPEDALEAGPRKGESVSDFEARLAMLDEVTPVLQDLTTQGFSIVVESDRVGSGPSGIKSDYIIEFGDLRIRVILVPRESDPLSDSEFSTRLAQYFIEAPDTDALAIVGALPECRTWVVDVYDVSKKDDARTASGKPLSQALSEYFLANLFSIELPDFRAILALPTVDSLEELLAEKIRTNFARVAEGKGVKISEKSTARQTLAASDLSRLLVALTRGLSLERIAPSELLSVENDES